MENKHYKRAYDISKEMFSNVLHNNPALFKDIVNFMTDDYSICVIEYEPTTLETRQSKYNKVNTHKKGQDKIHRTLSDLSELSYYNNYYNFQLDSLRAKEKIEDLIPQHLKSKINTDKILEKYLHLKASELCVKYKASMDATRSINLLSEKALSEKIGDNEFFSQFFNDIELFCNALFGRIKCNIVDSKFNRFLTSYISVLLHNMKNGAGRDISTTYYFSIIKKYFNIKGNCSIESVKDGISLKDLFLLFSSLFTLEVFYSPDLKVSSVGSDVRTSVNKLFGILLSDEKDSLTKQSTYAQSLSKIIIKSQAFTCLGRVGWNYTNSKKYKAFLGCSLVASKDDDTIDIQLKDVSKYLFNFYEYDIDHSLKKIDGGVNDFFNLGLKLSSDNRSENKTDGNKGRFINNGNYSFPKNMWDKLFTTDNLEERGEWMINKVQKIILDNYYYTIDFCKIKSSDLNDEIV